MSKRYDVVIVGAGVAGASLAYWLTETGITNVVVVERESRPRQHASGRSAATFLSFSGDPFERRAVVAAGRFFRNPPAGFGPLFDPTGVMLLFDEPDWDAARDAARDLVQLGQPAELLAPHEIAERLPVAIVGDGARGIYLPADGRLDVPALIDGYLDGARRRGATLLFNTEVVGVEVQNGVCIGVDTPRESLRAPWVVNAAGAWVGQLGQMAGATAIELEPRRRTVITFEHPDGIDVSKWPLVSHESRSVYFAPERAPGRAPSLLLACPMDNDPIAPCDAQPDPAVVALTRERLATIAPSLAPTELCSTRAGLRTFSPDERLVIGEDPALRGFFWLAGQGGWGIESSPIVSQSAAELITSSKTSWPEIEELSPKRFCLP